MRFRAVPNLGGGLNQADTRFRIVQMVFVSPAAIAGAIAKR